MRYSESQANLAAAISAAQGEIENSTKDGFNPHFKSEYTSLSEALNVVRPVFTKHGLSVVQLPTFNNGLSFLTTRILHQSGEWLEGDHILEPSKKDPQGYGAAITYARRYSLMAVAGIAPEDDDGNEASGKEPSKPEEKVTPINKPRFSAPAGNVVQEKPAQTKASVYVPASKLLDLVKLAKTIKPGATQDEAKAIVIDAAKRHDITQLTAITPAQFVVIEDEIRQTKI